MIYQFDRFRVDDKTFRLSIDGLPIPLEPKALRVLLYLVQNRTRLIRKQEILDAVWHEANVTEGVLTRSIGLLRKALHEHSREPRFIETVPTVGYRFIGSVSIPDEGCHLSAPLSLPPEVEPGPEPAALPLSQRRGGLTQFLLLAGCVALLSALTVWIFEKKSHAAAIHSLAVLPLENLSGDPSQEYFADGTTDELITELARIPGLRVVSRTSVMQDKGAHKSLRQIAEELNVDAIVEGSVVRSADRVRITAQLIDIRTDKHLWAHSFEGRTSDILSLQDSVANEIASQTQGMLLPDSRLYASADTIDPAVHDAYLRGRYFLNKRDVPHSVAAFQQAIDFDPGYASAYAGLADALESEMTLNIAPAETVMPKALAAAKHAIQLDPSNGEAYSALGSIQTTYYWDWPAAERNLTHAIALSPSYSFGEMRYAVFLDATSRPEDAILHMRHALALDPLSFLMNRHLGSTLYFARHYDEAIEQLQRAGDMEPQLTGVVDNWMSWAYEKKGMPDEAVDHDLAALHGNLPKIDTERLHSIYRQHGWNAYWQTRLDMLRPCEDSGGCAYELATIYLRLGNHNKAVVLLNHAIDRHFFWLMWIKIDPMLDGIRTDPQYPALLHRLNLPA